MSTEWIGVADVAAEMRYTERQAWEYIRSIGLVSANARKMKLARFTRSEFDEARDRAKAAIPPRVRTGAVPVAARAEAPAGKGRGAAPAASAASKLAKLRGA